MSDLPPTSARAMCARLTLSGTPTPEARAWLREQANLADDTATDRVGQLRCALWWLCESEVSWRLIGHTGQALAEALVAAGDERGERYGYVGSAGQVHHAR